MKSQLVTIYFQTVVFGGVEEEHTEWFHMRLFAHQASVLVGGHPK